MRYIAGAAAGFLCGLTVLSLLVLGLSALEGLGGPVSESFAGATLAVGAILATALSAGIATYRRLDLASAMLTAAATYLGGLYLFLLWALGFE
jgi:hypothetical protein